VRRILLIAVFAFGCAKSGTVPSDRRDAGPADFGPIVEPDLGGPVDSGVMDPPDMPPGPCDEGTSRACMSSCGSIGSSTCSGGTFGACAPPTESCDNGTDDDCDGNVDEGTDCSPGATEPCNTSCGSAGTRSCGTACGWGSCTPPAESCNGADDDCDGNVDETSACPAGTTRSCTTDCGSTGTQTCTASCGWPLCSPPAETCNGSDDDCDGAIDEGNRAITVNFAYSGELSSAQPTCNGTTERIGPACDSAFSRACNARGCPNSGFGPIENSGDVGFGTCVVGVAHTLSWATLAASHPGCTSPAASQSPDCNAAIHRWCRDNGERSGFGPTELSTGDATIVCTPWADVVNTAYSTLTTFHGPCDGSTERFGPNCNAAIHRVCTSRGAVSGFGPIENSGDIASVACLSN